MIVLTNDLMIHLRQRGHAWIIGLTGCVTPAHRGVLYQAYQGAVQARASTVVIDLTGVEYIVSDSIFLIDGLLDQVHRDNRRACLVGLSPRLRTRCQMMNFSGYAEVYDTVEEVLRLHS
jgi:anti-anti-sigma factor